MAMTSRAWVEGERMPYVTDTHSAGMRSYRSRCHGENRCRSQLENTSVGNASGAIDARPTYAWTALQHVLSVLRITSVIKGHEHIIAYLSLSTFACAGREKSSALFVPSGHRCRRISEMTIRHTFAK